MGASSVAFGAFDINTRTLPLQNSSGETAHLSVDLGGDVSLNGSNGIVTTPILHAWSPTIFELTDNAGAARNIT